MKVRTSHHLLIRCSRPEHGRFGRLRPHITKNKTTIILAVLLAGLIGLALWGKLGLRPMPRQPQESEVSRGRSAQGIDAYQLLWKAEQNLPESLPILLAMLERQDGAGYFARLAVARHYSAVNRHHEAAALYREALSLRTLAEPKDTAQVRRELAISLEQAQDAKGAFEEWARLLPDIEALRQSRRLAPDAISLASALCSARLYREALDVLSAEITPKAALLRARALASLGKHVDSCREYESYVRSSPDDHKARLEYAMALERTGRLQQALREYVSLGEAGLLGKGRVLAAMGKKRDAISAYLKSPSPEARRRAALLLQELGERNRALEIFVALAKSNSAVSQEALLRALSICESTGDARTRSELLPLLSPGTAWLRGVELTPRIVPDPPAGEHPSVSTAAAIVKALGPERGLPVAKVEIELSTRGARDEDQLTLGEWLRAAGEPRVALRIGMDVIKRLPCKRAFSLLYPLAFEEHVKRSSIEFGVDPFLIMAVMREESRFQPDAVSVAGAIGLMQVMPSTGKKVAATLGMPFKDDILFDPASNIRIGASYLKELLAEFKGDVPRAVAAYNAGPGSVHRWVAALGSRDSRYFFETIGYAETRGYLIKVIDSWVIYKWLYGGPGL